MTASAEDLQAKTRHIAFSPPDIREEDIEGVVEALRSGWITTGPRTKEFERALTDFTGADGVAALSSATAALECALRVLGIGPGDEVITSAYTYTSSCSCICHVGATPVLCDTAPGSFEMDYDRLADLITEKTKAVIPVDLGGRMVDYDRVFDVVRSRTNAFRPANDAQERLGRVAVVADGAHSLGATYHGRRSGSVADLTAFSFHAVKNLTTAEGGALAWRCDALDNDATYRQLMLLSLHGQTKDALSKTRAGAWEYDIAFPGYKCNMTDLQAALGLSQLARYPQLIARRHEILAIYRSELADLPVAFMPHADHPESGEGGFTSSAHLAVTRLTGKSSAFRNALIERMAERGVATNVHYKPLPLLTAYRDLGFDIADFPNASAQFENELTLPLHTLLTDGDAHYVARTLASCYRALEEEGVA